MTTPEQKKEWLERKEVLLLVSTILGGWVFDDNGLVKDSTSYERCTLAAVYFELLVDSGDGEHLDDPDGMFVYTIFQPTLLERQVLGLSSLATGLSFYESFTDSNGFVFGKECTKGEVEERRAKANSDNPDDEMEAFTTDEAEEGDEDATPIGDGEISF